LSAQEELMRNMPFVPMFGHEASSPSGKEEDWFDAYCRDFDRDEMLVLKDKLWGLNQNDNYTRLNVDLCLR
jgi:hypothetical protein